MTYTLVVSVLYAMLRLVAAETAETVMLFAIVLLLVPALIWEIRRKA